MTLSFCRVVRFQTRMSGRVMYWPKEERDAVGLLRYTKEMINFLAEACRTQPLRTL
jgi:hypothetical protein